MIPRTLAETLHRLAQSFPVIAITGPRQSGKTTLARAVFPDKPYASREDPSARAVAWEDPRGGLARGDQGAVVDEAQRWPDLFSYLQGMVDQQRTPGRFVLNRVSTVRTARWRHPVTGGTRRAYPTVAVRV